LTDVSGLRFHPCTIIPLTLFPVFLEKSLVMTFVLTRDIRG
jgi:hypothetical protein